MAKYGEYIFLVGLLSVFIDKESQFDNGIDDTDHIQSPAPFLAEEDFGEIERDFRRNQLAMLTYFYFGAIRQCDYKT